MVRDKDQQSKESLLRSHNKALAGTSDEDSGEDDIELSGDELRGSQGQSTKPAKQTSGDSVPLTALPAARISCWRRPSKACLIVSTLVSIGIIGLLVVSGFFVYSTAPPDGQSPPWYPSPAGGTLPSWQLSYEKARVLVSRMSLMEKVNITTGTGWSQDLCVGNTAPATSVGFPALCFQDGPLGLRYTDHSTAFPAGITVGATWNKELMYRKGRAQGREARLKGINVLLGPAMGPLGRTPAGGRNWEGFGADPVLQGVAAALTIKGIQEEGVIATAKHLLLNEQEHFRQSFEWGLPNAISSNADDRTIHELYLWPFAESVRAGVGSMMCSYNMLNNSYACGNSKLLNGLLKDELGFQGFVQSDWLAQRGGVSSALAGLDVSMPGDGLRWMDGDSLWGPKLALAVLNGSLPMDRLDDMVTRVVATWYQLGQDDKTAYPDDGPNFSSWTKDKMGRIHAGSDDPTVAEVNKFVDVQGTGDEAHGNLAREIAAEGIVLLKNEGDILPLDPEGFSDLDITAIFNVGIYGEDAGSGRGPNMCADQGCNEGTLGSGWGSGAADFPYLISPFEALKNTFFPESVQISEYLHNDLPIPVADPRLQDLCLVFANSDGGEGFIAYDGVRGDRNDLYLQKGGEELVREVANTCKATIVVIHSIGSVNMDNWIDLPSVKAVLMANLPGQESGNALVDVLFGYVDASGRLPYTLGGSPPKAGGEPQVMYHANGLIPQQNFDEGLYIDYRHFDRMEINPRFEFGFGLSYTKFEYDDLVLTTIRPKSPLPSPRPSGLTPPQYNGKIPDPGTALWPPSFRKLRKRIYPYIASTDLVKNGSYPYPKGYETAAPLSQAGGGPGGNPSLYDVHLNVSITVSNIGYRKGKDVVQLYVSFPDDVTEPATGERIEFPVRVLRAFAKVELAVGARTAVHLCLTRKDLSYWSVVQQNWVMPTTGHFRILVGRSSRKIRRIGQW